MGAPIQLTILRQGDTNIVDLAEVGSLIPRSETEVDDGFLRELVAEVSSLARASRARGETGIVRDLQRVGSLVFSHLLTEPARRRLRDAEPADLYLRLDEKLVHVPWELCFDGRDFLGTKFRVGRQVITARPIPEPRATRRRGTALRVLLVADPTETLPQVATEAEQLCALLDAVPGVEVTLLGGKSVRRIPLLGALAEHDVVHFAGHSHYDPASPASSGWRLHDGVLTAGELSKLRPPPALVFSNSCEAGASEAWDGHYRFEGQAFGIGSAFLLAGVQNYVGTFWVVHDAESMLVATTCYSALAAGASLGSALHQARQAVIAKWGWQGLTWASYLLYGDPAFEALPVGGERAVDASPLPQAFATAPRRASEVRRFDVDLGDSATEPSVIETVQRRGHRLIAEVVDATPAHGDAGRAESSSLVVWPVGGPVEDRVPLGLVGRGLEVEVLDEVLARAMRGERQVVFVTGEAGAGKTALVEQFLAGAAKRYTLAITGSNCVQQFGSAEAYLPVLEAIGRLVREHGASRSLLRRYAPMWFAQLPWLIQEEDRERLERELLGAARERMLREMADFVEAVAAEIPVILVLDDLHWSDPSTVDLLSLIAVRRATARLMVVGTYRPAELVLTGHPLRAVSHRLVTSLQCKEVSLDDLGVDAVAEYLARRFAGSRFPPEVPRLLRERTDGNPLFLVTLVDHLLARDSIFEREGQWHVGKELRRELAAVPESLRRLIGQQLERLGAEDRELLETASLVGFEFSAAAAAAGTNRDTTEAEESLERLADGGPFVRRAGSAAWPDGTVAGCFAFRHPLYREVLATAVPARRRADSHLRIGTVLERAHGERSSELGAELALHFEEGGDRARAARYRRYAADTAARRYAFAEAETHLEQGLALLGSLPASSERDGEELSFQSALGAVRMATRGYAATEVERAYTRALELASGTPQDPSVFPELWGLWVLHLTRAELDRALELAVRVQTIAETSGKRLLRLQGHLALWMTHFFRGDLDASLQHLDEGEPLYDPAEDRESALVYGQDAKAVALSHRSIQLWRLGRIDQSLEVNHQSVEYARTLGHPLSLALNMMNAGWLRILRREPQECQEQAEALLAYATEQGVPFWKPNALLQRGWALTAQGDVERGIADTEQGLALKTTMETGLGQTPHYAYLAAAKARMGRFTEARELIDRCKTLMTATGERYHEPEIHRIDAELVLAEAGGPGRAPSGARGRAEALLLSAIECAARQGSRTLELRATTSLVRLCRRGAKGRQAHSRLVELLAFFSEGFGTADLREARELAGEKL